MAIKSFATRIAIEASPTAVWAILTDASRYPEWNSTVSKVEGNIVAGGKVTVHAKISPGRAFPVTVETLEAPRRMVWAGGMPLGLFRGERVFEIVPKGKGCEVSMRETFTGLLAPLIGRTIPDLQPSFDEFARCLKQRAERA